MKEQLSDHFSIDFGFNNPEWKRIRTTPETKEELESRGREWVKRLNEELHAAQAKRKQPAEDGYKYEVTTEGSRYRLYVWPFTARAIAHEAVNQSMLKLVPVGNVKKNAGADHETPRELGRRGAKASGWGRK